MSDVGPILWLIPALPLLAAAIIGLFGPAALRKQSHWPCIVAIGGACVVAVMVFLAVYNAGHHPGDTASLVLAEDHKAGVTYAQEIFAAKQEKLMLETEMEITRRRRVRLLMPR